MIDRMPITCTLVVVLLLNCFLTHSPPPCVDAFVSPLSNFNVKVHSLPEPYTWQNHRQNNNNQQHVTSRIGFLQNSRWDREIEENSRKRASGGIGETAAGAVLGGMLLGPFGAMFGASIGSSIGAKNALDRSRKEEMERRGISQDMLDAAQEIGAALAGSLEGLKATQDSLETQQRFARRMNLEESEIYQRAQEALRRSDEEKARELLMERQRVLEKLKQVLKQCAEEKKRLEIMENNVVTLERRAMEVDSLLRRTVGAKAVLDSSGTDIDIGLSLSTGDPLLQKFRDLGID